MTQGEIDELRKKRRQQLEEKKKMRDVSLMTWYIPSQLDSVF